MKLTNKEVTALPQTQYILDLENVSLPAGWPATARKLKVQEGRYQADFDIVVFPKELELYLEQYRRENNMPIKTYRTPAGVDLSTLPVGAIIKKVNNCQEGI